MIASLVIAAALSAPGQPAGASVEAEPRPIFGVEQIVVGRRAKKRERNAAKRLSPQLLAALKGDRDDVVESKIGGRRQPPQVRNATKRRAAAYARAQDAGLSRVVSSHLSGKGKRAKLLVEVLGPGLDGPQASVEVRPLGRDRKTWQSLVVDAIGPAIAPEPQREPAEPPPAAAEPLERVAERAAPVEAGAVDAAPTPGTPTQGAQTPASMWPVVLASSGTFIGVAGALSGAAGGFFALGAWQQSNQLVELPAADARRLAMEEASLQKAMLADTLFVGGGVILLSGVSLWVAALLVE